MRTGGLVGHGVVIASLAVALASGSAPGEPLAREVSAAAADLASRLSTSPPASTWVADPTKESSFQADVNRMAYLSSLLAGELSSGKGREETRSIYRDLRGVGLRILSRSRATGTELPKAEVEAYEQLMSKLEAWYGPIR